MKDQDVDEAHEKNEFIPKVGCCMLKKWFVILRDEEVGGLDMETTDKDRVLRGDLTVTSLNRYVG